MQLYEFFSYLYDKWYHTSSVFVPNSMQMWFHTAVNVNKKLILCYILNKILFVFAQFADANITY